MKESLRTVVAGAAGAVIASTILLGQPALADHLKAAPKNSVNSKSIKDGSVKTKDLASDVNASLGKANSALQSVPDNGVTTSKLQDNAVTNPKLADNAVSSAEVAADSLTAADLAPNSVANSELAANSVTGTKIQDKTLEGADIGNGNGTTTLNFNNLAGGACQTATINPNPATGNLSLAGDIIMVSPGDNWVAGVVLQAKPNFGLGDDIDVQACNVTGGAIDEPNTDIGWLVIEN